MRRHGWVSVRWLPKRLIHIESNNEVANYAVCTERSATIVSEIRFFCMDIASWRGNYVHVTPDGNDTGFTEEVMRKLIKENSVIFSYDVVSERWCEYNSDNYWELEVIQ